MRLVHVSAHYPPDFVSGGTLVPARLSSELQARGHDVRVFAGHLGRAREPLSEWDELVDGVAVHWIAVRPFIGWAARSNYDNPSVAAAFASWLTGQRPDVVHFHSMQSLGAGLLPVAKASGARVVVTMHDFWWLCARQFLVNREPAPCCLVVDCGVCSCQVDHDWLRTRDASLRHRLAYADLVLAPSRSAARILVANGVDPSRVQVDENGLPSLPEVAPVSTPQDAPVRLLYTGGGDPMKGLPVLARAAERLAGLDGWELTVHGPADADIRREGLPVRWLPPYRPDELHEVLARHDVLVLPSLARETYSIMTREALAAGLAVVCSDAPGPEEAVRDGVNGLVVPAGDDLVLADALRRLVEEPDLLRSLRSRGLLTPLRTLHQQVDDLERSYAQLRARPAARPPSPAVRRVLFVVGIQGAPLRYRARLAAEGLELLGVRSDVRHYRDPEVPALAQEADAVVLYRVPASWQVLDVIEQVRRRADPVPLVFDVDDLIFDDSLGDEVRGLAKLPRDEVELWWQGVRRYRTTMEACDAYVGSTAMLVRHAASLTGMPSYRWDNGVGVLLGRASDAALAQPRAAGPVRLGYFSGTTTHDHDWAAVESAVVHLLQRRDDVELWLGGHLGPTSGLEQFGARVRRLPFVPWHELPALLHQIDVNLAPLELGGRFNEAKSAIKWLEAALVTTPTVASPTEPFREVVRHGENGMLAASVQDWVRCLDVLVDDVALRRRIGERARRDALLDLSPHQQGRRYLAVLEEVRRDVAASGHDRTRRRAPVVALDEPWQPSPLEPYAAPEPQVERSTTAQLRAGAARAARAARRLTRRRASAPAA